MRGRTTALALAVVLATSGCSLFKAPLSKEERARLAGQLGAIRARAKAMQKLWHAAMTVAQGRVVPRADLGACPISPSRLPAAGGGGANSERIRQMAMTSSLLGASDRMVIDAKGLAGARSPRVRKIERELGSIEGDLVPGSGMIRSKSDAQSLIDKVAKLAAPTWWTWDVTVLVDKETTPGLVDEHGKRFEPGASVGRSYLFDYREKKIVCAGAFAARSSKTVRYSKRLGGGSLAARGAVGLDLSAQTLDAGIGALYRAGPPRAKAASSSQPSPRASKPAPAAASTSTR